MKITSNFFESHLFRLLSYFFSGDESQPGGSKIIKALSFPRLEKAFLPIAFLIIILVTYQGLLEGLLNVDLSFTIMLLLFTGFVAMPKLGYSLKNADFWLLLFVVISLVSGVLAVVRGVAPVVVILGMVITFQFAAAILISKKINLQKTAKFFSFICLPPAVYGLWQAITGTSNSPLWFSSFEAISAARAHAWYGSPNIYGIIMAVAFILAIAGAIKDKKVLNYKCLLAAVYLVAVVVSYSRSVWLALALAVVISVALYRIKLLSLMPLAGLFLFVDGVRSRLLALFDPRYQIDSALDGRLWALNNGLYIWQKQPFFGFGPGSYGGEIAKSYASNVYLAGMQQGYTPIYYTDNQWLELLVQTGALGLISFAFYIVSETVRIIAEYRKTVNIYALAALSVMIIFIVTGFSGNVIEFTPVSVLAGLIIGSSINEA